MFPYVHCRVDLGYGLVIQGELVDLDPVADELAHDFDLELVQLALTDGVGFGDHRDDVDLQRDRTPPRVSAPSNTLFFSGGSARTERPSSVRSQADVAKCKQQHDSQSIFVAHVLHTI